MRNKCLAASAWVFNVRQNAEIVLSDLSATEKGREVVEHQLSMSMQNRAIWAEMEEGKSMISRFMPSLFNHEKSILPFGRNVNGKTRWKCTIDRFSIPGLTVGWFKFRGNEILSGDTGSQQRLTTYCGFYWTRLLHWTFIRKSNDLSQSLQLRSSECDSVTASSFTRFHSGRHRCSFAPCISLPALPIAAMGFGY